VLSFVLEIVRNTIKAKAQFDINDLKPIKHVTKTFVPGFTSSPLVSSAVLHFPTRFERSFTSSPLVSSEVLHLLYSLRV
jgi:hypothetical protein